MGRQRQSRSRVRFHRVHEEALARPATRGRYGFRFDSPLATVVGVCFATVAIAGALLGQSNALHIQAVGGPAEAVLGVGAIVIVAALWILTDDAFDR